PSYARETYEAARFGEAVAVALRAGRRRFRLQAALTAVVIMLVSGSITAVPWIGAQAVVAGTMSPRTLCQLVRDALVGAGTLGALAEVWAEVQRAAGGMARIEERLGERSGRPVPAAPARLAEPVRGHILFDHIRFHYPSRPDAPALEEFSLEVRPGETVALVGPSGAGKSTVFHLPVRLHHPQEGQASVDGLDLRDLDLVQLRRHIALVPQDPVIFAASARDNIGYGRLDAGP